LRTRIVAEALAVQQQVEGRERAWLSGDRFFLIDSQPLTCLGSLLRRHPSRRVVSRHQSTEAQER
jgi:hypothetical protein